MPAEAGSEKGCGAGETTEIQANRSGTSRIGVVPWLLRTRKRKARTQIARQVDRLVHAVHRFIDLCMPLWPQS